MHPQPVRTAPTSGLAVISLTAGIVSVIGGLCLVVPPFVAIFAGHMAYPQTRSGFRAGHGMVVAGLILGYLTGAVVFAAGLVWFFTA